MAQGLRLRIIPVVAGLLLTFFSLSALSQNVIEKKLLGKWKMHEVYQNGENVTVRHNPSDNRWFEFKSDGTFESGGDPYGKNTGRYFPNNLNSLVYMDSDVGPEDDSIWKMTFENDRMIWQGVGTKWAEGFKLIHIRSVTTSPE